MKKIFFVILIIIVLFLTGCNRPTQTPEDRLANDIFEIVFSGVVSVIIGRIVYNILGVTRQKPWLIATFIASVLLFTYMKMQNHGIHLF